MFRKIILCICILFFAQLTHAKSSIVFVHSGEAAFNTENGTLKNLERINCPNRILFQLKKRFTHTKKVTAAVMAFPLPFGIVGLHRIYLGTQPYVPVVYIATVGGCFGILPTIDFFVILFGKDTGQFENNPRVFMWAK